MKMIPLPDAMAALERHLFYRSGAEYEITLGWKNSTPQMQQAFPLEKRLRHEREGYANRVNVIVASAIKTGKLAVGDYFGAPIDGSTVFGPEPTGVALHVSLENLQVWLRGWMLPPEAKLFMRQFGVTQLHETAAIPGPKKGTEYDQGKLDAPVIWRDFDAKYRRGELTKKPTLEDVADELVARYPKTSKLSWVKRHLNKRNVTSYNP